MGNVYNKYHPVVTANGVRVIKPDVRVGRGSIVHVIDEVLPYLTEADSIPAVLTKDPRFSTLLAAVGAAALAKIPPSALGELLKPENKQKLTDILLRHVVPEVIFSKGICWKTYKTLNPKANLYTQLYKGGLVVAKTSAGHARVVDADIVATNGVVHAIDTVI